MGDEGQTPGGREAQRPLREREWGEDISDTVAPSVGPYSTVTHHPPPGERRSDVDALGLDKRRPVVGANTAPASPGRRRSTARPS
jgi:hypothetical protein